MRLDRFKINEATIKIISEEPDMSFLDPVDELSKSNHYEYQIRWIGGPVYYKRERGNETWTFCTDQEFAENVSRDNLIEWKTNKLDGGDKIPGGLADNVSPRRFKESDLVDGMKVEFEHTNDLYIAREIAMDHLIEDPDYYKKLNMIHR